jgi:hypothetical protein
MFEQTTKLPHSRKEIPFHGSEHAWNLMFMGLKELVETGKISYKG